MDNVTIFDTVGHEKRGFCYNLNYLKHVVTQVTHANIITNIGIQIFVPNILAELG